MTPRLPWAPDAPALQRARDACASAESTQAAGTPAGMARLFTLTALRWWEADAGDGPLEAVWPLALERLQAALASELDFTLPQLALALAVVEATGDPAAGAALRTLPPRRCGVGSDPASPVAPAVLRWRLARLWAPDLPEVLRHHDQLLNDVLRVHKHTRHGQEASLLQPLVTVLWGVDAGDAVAVSRGVLRRRALWQATGAERPGDPGFLVDWALRAAALQALRSGLSASLWAPRGDR